SRVIACMPMIPRVRVKVCCIASSDELRLAVAMGADAVGLVSAMPSGPGPIEETRIAELARRAPPAVATFLLTSLQDVPSIVAQQRRCGANTVQLVDRLERGTHAELREAMPGVAVVQVIHVTGPESVDEAVAVAPHVSALLLDSGRPSLAVKELGGTGRTHDWRVSRAIRDAVAGVAPVFLAGGLRADNVADAIDAVDPFGVDLCSGVRTDGRLDARKLGAFMTAVAARGAAPGSGGPS
ncbi:MAG TPA: phosphoribosylanthranilate isomerase, partial [Gemmatimonadaceae bacterium]|nr:phosphoribosylanthranilate isomerase [Gemmatimonadaceae bacterium]